MDVQLKRGMLDACVLTVLRRGDSYGYQLVRDVGEIIAVSESTLYPILKRLEVLGQVTVYSVEHNGRLRKFYHLTDRGAQRIPEFLSDFREIQKIYDYIRGRWQHE